MKKRLLALLVVAMLLVLVACGNSTTTSAVNSPAPSEEVSAPVDAPITDNGDSADESIATDNIDPDTLDEVDAEIPEDSAVVGEEDAVGAGENFDGNANEDAEPEAETDATTEENPGATAEEESGAETPSSSTDVGGYYDGSIEDDAPVVVEDPEQAYEETKDLVVEEIIIDYDGDGDGQVDPGYPGTPPTFDESDWDSESVIEELHKDGFYHITDEEFDDTPVGH